MYSRKESGEGIARNWASHSRWAFAASAVKPRRSSAREGAAASNRTLSGSAASELAITRIRTNLAGRVRDGSRALRGWFISFGVNLQARRGSDYGSHKVIADFDAELFGVGDLDDRTGEVAVLVALRQVGE